MSYEKVKCITRKPKEGKIFITSACNNVRPLTYHRWEFMQNSNDYHEKELELMRGINGGGLILNDSCYNWNYAKLKTRDYMQKKYGNDYDLYDLSTMKYTSYCLGEQISSTYTPIITPGRIFLMSGIIFCITAAFQIYVENSTMSGCSSAIPRRISPALWFIVHSRKSAVLLPVPAAYSASERTARFV